MARVDIQLDDSRPCLTLLCLLLAYNGPEKSMALYMHGGPSQTRSTCRSGNSFPSYYLHMVHLLTILLTASHPLYTHCASRIELIHNISYTIVTNMLVSLFDQQFCVSMTRLSNIGLLSWVMSASLSRSRPRIRVCYSVAIERDYRHLTQATTIQIICIQVLALHHLAISL